MERLGDTILGFMLGYLILSWIILPVIINSIDNKHDKIIKILKEK